MIRTIAKALVLALGVSSPAAAETVWMLPDNELVITLPEEYRSDEPYEGAYKKYRFVRWFALKDGVVGNMKPPELAIRRIKVFSADDLSRLTSQHLAALDHKYQYWIAAPDTADRQAVLGRYCDGWKELWEDMPGWRGFGDGHFDAETGFGWCVNFGGGSVTVARLIGDSLVSVETVNQSEFSSLGEDLDVRMQKLVEMSILEKFSFVRNAVGSRTVERILKNVRTVP